MYLLDVLVRFVPDSIASEFWWSASSNTTKTGGVMWIPCLQTNTPRENVETPSAVQTLFLEAMLGDLRRLSCLEPRHGSFTSTFRRRILCGGNIAGDSRHGTLESPAGRSFDPSAEGAMTTARRPLSLIICPCLSCQRTTALVHVVEHTAAVVSLQEHFACAERSGITTHQRLRLGSLTYLVRYMSSP